MKRVPDPNQMKAAEGCAIKEIGMPSLVLMERAAMAVAEQLGGRLKGRPSVLAVCGTGNNGADGLAVARILHLQGVPVTVKVVGNREKATAEWRTQEGICLRLNVPFSDGIEDADVVIDALFGIGLGRELTGDFRDAVEKMNRLTGYKVAVDLPSGISGASGAVLGTAFRADLTVTFQFVKPGLLLYPGREYCGEVVCAGIGIPDNGLPPESAFAPEQSDLAAFRERPQDSNKGTFGRILVIAGAEGMCGAAYLSALAAYRTGAGLVEICTPAGNRIPLQERIPEAVLTCYEQEHPDFARIGAALDRADAVVLGPGLSTADYAKELVAFVLAHVSVPLVIDADALNILAKHGEWLEKIPSQAVITPHIREMARLTGLSVPQIKENPLGTAKRFAMKYGPVTVLKDAATITASPDGRCCINTSGCSAMATGGSGDVLTGILAARCAVSPQSIFENAALCVYLHGLAGEKAAERLGEASVMAGDIANAIGEVLC